MYVADFLFYKLHISQDIPSQSVTEQLLGAYLKPVTKLIEEHPLKRLIALHVHFRVNQIDLQRLAKMLTHLPTLESLDRRSSISNTKFSTTQLPSLTASSCSPSAKISIDAGIAEFASIVCNTLYDAINTYLYGREQNCSDQISEWCNCYQSIVS